MSRCTLIRAWIILGLMLGGHPCGFVLAQGKPSATAPAQKERSAPEPGQIELDKSRVYVYVGKKGFGHEHAVEGKIKSGSIDLSAEKNPGEIVFDMASFTADTDEARQHLELEGTTDDQTREKVTETMKGPQVLDVEEHPTARFKIKSRAKRKTEHGIVYVFEGDFTLHGKTRTISVEAEPGEAPDKQGRRHLVGEFTILQSDYGIKPYKAALGAVGVADKLKIRGDLWIHEKVTPK